MNLKNGLLASGSEEGKILIWSIQNGTNLFTLNEHEQQVFSLVELPNGNLVSTSWDKLVIIWDLVKKKSIKKFKAHERAISSTILFSNKYLITGSYDYSIKIWDIYTWQELKLIQVPIVVNTLAKLSGNFFSSGFKIIDDFANINIWEINDGNGLDIMSCKNLTLHKKNVNSIVLFKTDLLASGSEDETINIWNITTGKLITTLKDHSKSVTDLAVLTNGFLVSASNDQTIKIRDNNYWKNINLDY